MNGDSRKRPQVITILAYISLVLGVLAVVCALLSLALVFVLGSRLLTTAALLGLYGVYGLVLGYGLLRLKRWTLPLLVVVNLIGVAEHFLLNIPFDLSSIIPWLVLFYVGKNHELFEKNQSHS